jgi:uncharacterized NAD(P)/FAD-binding protein YdhS
MTPRPEVVAIIGGGASGVLTAAHVFRAAEAPVRVVIIEPRAELGEGVAYGTTDLSHLLNVRAASLSGIADEPDHFAGWAGRRAEADGRSFLPRAWYAEYLRTLLGPVEHIGARAVDVHPASTGVQVVLSDGTGRTVDRVVLAPGLTPSVWPEHLGAAGRRWIGDPWAAGALADLHPSDPVLLVGTGLTAVDVALSLQTAGHDQIFAASRHGLLPAAHPDRPFTPLVVVPPNRPTARSLLAWARATADEVGDWRRVIDALRPHTDDLWGAMTASERTRLLRHLQPRWEVTRHRMAPSVATRIAAMQAAGHLTVLPGGVVSASTTHGGVDVTLADRRLRVGAVINCTGPSPDVRRTTHPLVRRLLDRGIAQPGPHHLGIDTDQHGRLPAAGDALWLVGPLRRGHRWETTAIPEIRIQAADLSQSLWRTHVLERA